MEANNNKGRSNSRLRQRLARIFRGSGCATTAGDVPQEPVFVPCPRHSLLDRSLSFSYPDRRGVRHPPLTSLHCGSCRPAPGCLSRNSGKVFKKERRVTETGSLYETGEREGSTCPPASPVSPLKSSYYHHHYCSNYVEKKKKKKKKLLSNGYGFSSSSSSDEAGDGFFSSEEGEERNEEESETLFSSKSFSSDSSEFYQHPQKKKPAKNNSKKKTKKNKSPSSSSHGATSNGYRPLVSISSRDYEYISEKEAAAQTGFAVVKKSRDPYADFRSSMLEMIVKTQMFGPGDLEKLLHSYLSLNSHHHHAIIVKAFSDIWEALFGN